MSITCRLSRGTFASQNGSFLPSDTMDEAGGTNDLTCLMETHSEKCMSTSVRRESRETTRRDEGKC